MTPDERDEGSAKPRPDKPDDRSDDWVGASGVSGAHVIAGDRTPKLHIAMMVLGPLGLAVAILLSLWSSSRRVEHSVNVQVEATWRPGGELGLRTQLLGHDARPLVDVATVHAELTDASGAHFPLGELEAVGEGLSQRTLRVPVEAAVGEGALTLHFAPQTGAPAVRDEGGRASGAPAPIEAFDEHIPISIVARRDPTQAAGRPVVAKHMLQWADDTDEQPELLRIDLRPEGRLLAGFRNRVFVRVTDLEGAVWEPEHVPAEIQIRLVSGEFAGQVGDPEHPPLLFEGPLDALGLVSVGGELNSDVVRFEVRLRADEAGVPDGPGEPSTEPGEQGTEPGTKPDTGPDTPGTEPGTPKPELDRFTGPKRRLRFVSHAGTVRVHADVDIAEPGDTIHLDVEAISTRRPVYVDIHGPQGAWLDTLTPPLRVPQERDWVVPRGLRAGASEPGSFIQFEAYQSVLRPEEASAIARVQLSDAGPREALRDLIARHRAVLTELAAAEPGAAELGVPGEELELERERAYLDHVEARLGVRGAEPLSDEALARARAFLIANLGSMVYGPPQALSTRERQDAELEAFKARWAVGVRWFLLGGGALFIIVAALLIGLNQRRLTRETYAALGLRPGAAEDPLVDLEELRADHALVVARSRREMIVRGVLTIALVSATLMLTLAMLESLVWNF